MTLVLLASAIVLSFVLPLIQSLTLGQSGSDHHVHVFLLNVIRENKFRFFARVPRLINPSFLGAYPIYLHYLLARFPATMIPFWSLILNPTFNLLICVAIIAFLRFVEPGNPQLAAVVGLAYALTPQHYHALSARNFGISSRSAGILFVTLYFIMYFLFSSSHSALAFAALVAAGYLVIGFSTFGTQAFLLASLVIMAIDASLWLAVSAAASFGIFIALHPRYSLSYLKHTLLFINVYRTQSAAIFILRRRYGIWRDLVWDMWVRLRLEGFRKGGTYIYGNSVLIVLLLNPLAVLSAWYWLVHGFTDPVAAYCAEVAAAGMAIAIATSFRPTRFLGEPERYVEMMSGFSAIAGMVALLSLVGERASMLFLLLSAAVSVIQLILSSVLRQHVGKSSQAYLNAFKAIETHAKQVPIRFSSNNDEVIKQALTKPWDFARQWSPEVPFAGQRTSDVYSEFPMMNTPVFVRAVIEYGLTAVVIDLDGIRGDDAALGDALARFELVYADERYKAYVR